MALNPTFVGSGEPSGAKTKKSRAGGFGLLSDDTSPANRRHQSLKPTTKRYHLATQREVV